MIADGDEAHLGRKRSFDPQWPYGIETGDDLVGRCRFGSRFALCTATAGGHWEQGDE